MRQTMGWSTPDKIIVRGKDLAEELIGQVTFAEMFCLELEGTLPDPGRARVVDAVLVTLMEHGITANSLAARLTHLAAPESLQGAVAAGILGAGDRFLGAIEGCARILQGISAQREDDLDTQISDYLDGVWAAGQKVPGIGHPVHKPVDPRTPALFRLAEEELGTTTHVEILRGIQQAAEKRWERVLPINADGAIAAVLSDAGFPWQICRGFAIVARAAGLVGHVRDELASPIASDVWALVEDRTEYVDPA